MIDLCNRFCLVTDTWDIETMATLLAEDGAMLHPRSPEQVFSFEGRGLLQRIDYVADVAGGVAACYCYDHAWFGSLLFPTLRRVVRRRPEGASPAQPTAILGQIADIALR